MINLSAMKFVGRPLLLMVLCFGFLTVTSADLAITRDGCNILEAGPGGFNAGPPVNVQPTGGSHCGTFSPAADISAEILPINNDSLVVVNAPAALTPIIGNFTGTVAPSFTGSAPCRSFYGRTNDNPALDKGVIDFEHANPSGQYRGCATLNTTKNVPGVQAIYDIDGWGWNTNLGWVSMGADGAPPRNRGLDAGAVTYKSEIRIFDAPVDGHIGELIGFWWNDSLGWVKLNCKADTTLNSTDTDLCAPGTEFGVKIHSIDNATGRVNLINNAWSESFGYINFKGVQVDLDGVAFDYEPRVTVVAADTGSDNLMQANGEDAYDIRLKFYDGSTDVTDLVANNSNFGFCLDFQDNRKIDSRTGTSINKRYVCAGVPGPSGNTSNNYDDLDLSYLAYDPTDAILQGKPQMVLYDSVLKAFKLDPSKYIDSELSAFSNDLYLQKVHQYSTLTNQLIEKDVSGVNFNFRDPFRLDFVSGHGVAESACDNGGLLVDLENPMDVSICGKYLKGPGMGTMYVKPGEVKVNPAYDTKVTSAKAFEENVKTGSLIEFTDRRLFANDTNYNSFEFAIGVELAQGVTAAELEPIKELLDIRMSSSVEYTTSKGRTVFRKGPEIADKSLNIFELNIQGSLTDRAFASGTFQSGVRDSGGVGVSANKRTSVTKSLRNVRAAALQSRCGNLRLNEVGFEKAGDLITKECKPIGRAGDRDVYYFRSVEKDVAAIRWSDLLRLMEGERTEDYRSPVFVMEGINLIWDEDYMTDKILGLVSSGDEVEFGSQLQEIPGVVVLKSDFGVGGNIVIPTYVSDVLAYIYADGRLLSAPNYDFTTKAALSNDPDSVLDRNSMPEEPFFNQLALVGQLYSSNCIGCSTNVPPLRADGSISESRSDAMNDDLNAFRYTPLEFGIVSGKWDPFLFGDPTFYMDKVCYLDCGTSVSSVFERDANGNLTDLMKFDFASNCSEVGSKLNQNNACLDKGYYDNQKGSEIRLSRFLDAVAFPTVLQENPNYVPNASSSSNTLNLFGKEKEKENAIELDYDRNGETLWQFGVLDSEGGLQNQDDSKIRSMNLYYLPVDADVPVFGGLRG